MRVEALISVGALSSGAATLLSIIGTYLTDSCDNVFVTTYNLQYHKAAPRPISNIALIIGRKTTRRIFLLGSRILASAVAYLGGEPSVHVPSLPRKGG